MAENNISFDKILEDFSKVKIYHNIPASSISNKYNIKSTPSPIKNDDKYYLGFIENLHCTRKQRNIVSKQLKIQKFDSRC